MLELFRALGEAEDFNVFRRNVLGLDFSVDFLYLLLQVLDHLVRFEIQIRGSSSSPAMAAEVLTLVRHLVFLLIAALV